MYHFKEIPYQSTWLWTYTPPCLNLSLSKKKNTIAWCVGLNTEKQKQRNTFLTVCHNFTTVYCYYAIIMSHKSQSNYSRSVLNEIALNFPHAISRIVYPVESNILFTETLKYCPLIRQCDQYLLWTICEVWGSELGVNLLPFFYIFERLPQQEKPGFEVMGGGGRGKTFFACWHLIWKISRCCPILTSLVWFFPSSFQFRVF